MDNTITHAQRAEVYYRSHGRCEALISVRTPGLTRVVWTRCFDMPVELHHALTRSRGGDMLDRVGETYHLIALCGNHHRLAHREVAIAYEGNALISGQVTWDHNRSVPVYTGPDEYLTATYPPAEAFSG